jgi:hypothetical protein
MGEDTPILSDGRASTEKEKQHAGGATVWTATSCDTNSCTLIVVQHHKRGLALYYVSAGHACRLPHMW